MHKIQIVKSVQRTTLHQISLPLLFILSQCIVAASVNISILCSSSTTILTHLGTYMKHSFVYGLWKTFDVIITSPAYGVSCLGFTKIQTYQKNTRIDPEKNTAILPFLFNSRVTVTSILSMCVSYNRGHRPVGRNSCKPYNVSHSVPSNIRRNDACNVLRCTWLSYISEHAISVFPSQWLQQIKPICLLLPEFYSRIHRFFS